MLARLEGAGKQYQSGDQTIVALQATDLELQPKELLLIIGPSGSGKTTLLSLIGCVIYPSFGELYVNGHHVNTMKQKELAALRLSTIGFVFQQFNLLAPLTAEENVAVPLKLQGLRSGEIRKKVKPCTGNGWHVGSKKESTQAAVGRPATKDCDRPGTGDES